jgi:hypothetical protein
LTTDLTYYSPKWHDDLPPEQSDGYWLGESLDCRQWLLKWIMAEKCFAAAGYTTWAIDRPMTFPEFRLIRNENATFIVRHTALPATKEQEAGAS